MFTKICYALKQAKNAKKKIIIKIINNINNNNINFNDNNNNNNNFNDNYNNNNFIDNINENNINNIGIGDESQKMEIDGQENVNRSGGLKKKIKKK